MKRTIAIIVGSLLLLGLFIWGYDQSQKKNRLYWELNSLYRRAFEEIYGHSKTLEAQIGKTLVSMSLQQNLKQAAKGWRQAYAVVEDLGQLPVTTFSLEKTKAFYNQLGDFTYTVAIKDTEGKSLSAEERKTLEKYYQELKKINQNLENALDSLKNQPIMITKETKLYSVREDLMPKEIVTALRNIENGVVDLRNKKVAYEGDFVNVNPYSLGIPGKPVSMIDAQKNVKAYLGQGVVGKVIIPVTKVNGLVSSYLYEVIDRRSKTRSYYNVSVNGGKVLSFLTTRPTKKPTFSVAECVSRAKAYLRSKGFRNLEATEVDRLDNEVSITFASKVDDIIYYPKVIKVKVGMDKGDITAFEGTQYYLYDRPRPLNKLLLNEERAKKNINQGLKILRIRKAVILNDRNQETLTYEFLGKLLGEKYLIYVNTETGKEEKIVRLKEIKLTPSKEAEAVFKYE
ncbi:germination protein YpeB [Carboxydothermus pertinax]|uniref:Germination protein YpeB n=1 Tax=Carboxydothermus pertinax TaxID=870242 RepID=A0A1L8CW11_9THEO|nr:germination protein YpeB [Carboxydothermus pertinax]GAV23108.1 germination protein YpeB [Carboxydothermus pertinax]